MVSQMAGHAGIEAQPCGGAASDKVPPHRRLLSDTSFLSGDGHRAASLLGSVFGRKPITGKEYTAVAEYLGVTVQEAFESRQLELFKECEKTV